MITQSIKSQTTRQHRRESWNAQLSKVFRPGSESRIQEGKATEQTSSKLEPLNHNRPCSDARDKQPERKHLATTLDRGLKKLSKFNNER